MNPPSIRTFILPPSSFILPTRYRLRRTGVAFAPVGRGVVRVTVKEAEAGLASNGPRFQSTDAFSAPETAWGGVHDTAQVKPQP
jgi:hypothetical protein